MPPHGQAAFQPVPETLAQHAEGIKAMHRQLAAQGFGQNVDVGGLGNLGAFDRLTMNLAAQTQTANYYNAQQALTGTTA